MLLAGKGDRHLLPGPTSSWCPPFGCFAKKVPVPFSLSDDRTNERGISSADPPFGATPVVGCVAKIPFAGEFCYNARGHTGIPSPSTRGIREQG